MCFSFEADLAAAAVLTPVGILTLRAAKTRNQVAVASIPLFFAAHQAVEAVVWLGNDGKVSSGLGSAAIYLYLIMAQIMLPILVPLAVRAIEPNPRVRLYLLLSAIGGVIVASRFGYILATDEVWSYAEDRVMVYKTTTDMGLFGGIFYLNATVITTLFATGRYLKLFGAANIIGICMAGWLRYEAVTSIWCIYAAFISGLILLHLKMMEWEGQGRGPGGPGGPARTQPQRQPEPTAAA